MKEIWTESFVLRLLSLLMAFILWLVIINIEDPAIVTTFEGIPVTVINESALDSVDKVYDIVSGREVEVRGKRSAIEKINKSNFIATADLEELSIVNAMEIKVAIPEFTGQVEIVGQSSSTMTISLENFVTEQFRVDILERGNVREGYYISEKTASPNIVQLQGAESVISKIKEVVVDVNVSGADKTFTITASPQVFDHNGTLMDLERMELSHSEFDITVKLLQTKMVNFYLELVGTPAAGFDYMTFEYEPKEVEIAGTEEELAKVPHITGTYNITNAREDIEDEVNIDDFIKYDVILIDDNQSAVVNVDVEPLESKSITIPINSLEVDNLPEDKTIEFMNASPIAVKVSGLRSELAKIDQRNIRAHIDLSEFEGNNGYAPVIFYTNAGKVEFANVSTLIQLHNK